MGYCEDETRILTEAARELLATTDVEVPRITPSSEFVGFAAVTLRSVPTVLFIVLLFAPREYME
jgi:hypothetical protein